MWAKLIFNSFHRDRRRKIVALSAVTLATCLATFLLNWSLNLGDKVQRELRSFGANIIIVPQGDTLPVVSGASDAGFITTDQYLRFSDLSAMDSIFWKNQILAMAPVLPQQVRLQGHSELLTLIGTEFGNVTPVRSYPKLTPYLELQGRWPKTSTEIALGAQLAARYGFKPGNAITLVHDQNGQTFTISGIVSSGGVEEKEMFAYIDAVQKLTGHPNQFKQLYVSALLSAPNSLYYKHERNPDALTSQETERFYCTPYPKNVAADIVKILPGSEQRVVKQITQTEEKIVSKINWLMLLVSLAGLIASSLTMTSTTTAMILERRKELALMKAVGSTNTFLLTYLFGEILILGVVGSLLGYGIGVFLSVTLSGALFDSAFTIKWAVMPLVAAIGVLIIFCGSLWPLRQATTLNPAVALRDL
jgi:putative ABC transport system permease protein